jgi:hypothetical protein
MAVLARTPSSHPVTPKAELAVRQRSLLHHFALVLIFQSKRFIVCHLRNARRSPTTQRQTLDRAWRDKLTPKSVKKRIDAASCSKSDPKDRISV